MRIAFAPLEGLTDAIYRRTHHALFSGVSQYFMPFISPSSSLSYTSRQQADFSPKENAGVPAVPQILSKDAALTVQMIGLLKDAGYTEVNLNLGCPSGTVTGKGKGAAMLKDPEALSRYLDTIYAHSPLPVSLKTRVGYDSVSEFPRLLSLFVSYPVSAWYLHPRTCREFYGGFPHQDCYAEALEKSPFPVIYNGDLFTLDEALSFLARFPDAPGLMLGRGLATNPALAQEINGGEPLTLDGLSAFHDALYRAYLKSWPEAAAVGRMLGVMAYLIQALDCPPPLLRALRKATHPDAYWDAAAAIFSTCTLKQNPTFVPPQRPNGL